MGTLRHAVLRGAGAAVALVAVLLTSACGLRYELTINSDDTIDLVYTVWDSSGMALITESSCTEAEMADSVPFPKGADVTFTYLSEETYPTCQVEGHDVPLDDFNKAGKDAWSLTHSKGAYDFTMSPAAALGDSSRTRDANSSLPPVVASEMTADVSVTFPGEVTESNGTVEDTTVSWTGLTSGSKDLHARGKDSTPSLPLLLLTAASVVLLVVVFAVVSIVIGRRRKRTGQAAPAAAGSAAGPADTSTLSSGYAPGQQAQPVHAPGQDLSAAPSYPGQQAQQTYAPGPAQPAPPYYPGYSAAPPDQQQALPPGQQAPAPDHRPYMPDQATPAPSSYPDHSGYPGRPGSLPATLPLQGSYHQESQLLPTSHVPVADGQTLVGVPPSPGGPAGSTATLATQPLHDPRLQESYLEESHLPTFHVPVAGASSPTGGPHEPEPPTSPEGQQA